MRSRPCIIYCLLWIVLIGLSACKSTHMPATSKVKAPFDWQGHRGARGLVPENTVAAFLKALEYPAVTTLELDLAISKDLKVMVSHEPWMSAEICSHPDGAPVTKEEESQLLLFQMTAAEISRFDSGRRGHPRFATQAAAEAHKPTLEEVVGAVNAFCKKNKRPLPHYNIEIKSRPDWDGTHTPKPEIFASLVLKEIEKLRIIRRACIQSFDIRPLQYLHQEAPGLILAFLCEEDVELDKQLNALGFRPNIYSPYAGFVTPELVEKVHQKGMRIIPWTVNETAQMTKLVEMGVDGLITDYPDRIPSGR